MIPVINMSSKPIEVAISFWSGSSSAEYYKIEPYASERWNRADKRGFVMSIRRVDKSTHSYFIKFDSKIIVTDTAVTDNNKVITPLL